MNRRGATLIEVLVGALVFTLVMAGFMPAFMNALKLQVTSVTVPGAQNDAKNLALKIADAARGATLCTASDAGCTLDAAGENASATGVTLYQRNDDGTLTKRTYAVSGGVFTVQIGSAAAAPVCNGATLALNYYGAPSYNATTLTSFVPTATTFKSLAAIEIVASVAANGATERYATLIRLRNSPKPQ